MTGGSVILDTSAVIRLLDALSKPAQTVESTQTAFVPVVVVGELRFGAERSASPSTSHRSIDMMLRRCRLLSPDAQTARVYGTIKAELAEKRTPIPEGDLWIAAAGLVLDASVVTTDAHFDRVSNLATIAPEQRVAR